MKRSSILLAAFCPTAAGWNPLAFFTYESPAASLEMDPTLTPTPADVIPGPDEDLLGRNTPLMAQVAAPFFGEYGPEDAPHLRYIPSYFSKQLPVRIKNLLPYIREKIETAKTKLLLLLLYKPPVGLVGAWCCMRVLDKTFRLYSPPPPATGEEALAKAEVKLLSFVPNSLSKSWGSLGKMYGASLRVNAKDYKMQQLQKRKRRRRRNVRRGRSFDLDVGDGKYSSFGGVDAVRVRACLEGLQSALDCKATSESNAPHSNPSSLFGNLKRNGDRDSTDLAEYEDDVKVAMEGLKLSCPPRGSREYFVEQSVDAVSKLSKYTSPTRQAEKTACSVECQNVQLLLHHSATLIELRVLDALLRTLRDRHLIVATRLRRTREYWKWRIRISVGFFGRLVSSVRHQLTLFLPFLDSEFRDVSQREFELACATSDRELEWLGKVESLLLNRPQELEVDELLNIVGDSKGMPQSWWNSFAKVSAGSPSQPSMATAIKLLLKSNNRMWIKESEAWTRSARDIIKDSLDGTISSTFTPLEDLNTTKVSCSDIDGADYAESKILKLWAQYDGAAASDTTTWLTVLSLVDQAANAKRAGEKGYFDWTSAANAIKRFDIMGIPSSALLLMAASRLHDNVINPNKEEIVRVLKSVFAAAWGIVEFRFYQPIRDIVLDLLNRRPRLVDPFSLLNEQTSLDNMLKDLGVGDGTSKTRVAALASASRMYEREVSRGAIRGLVSGKVAQLMLIQIQQLKADLLSAMDQIDLLVDANRLNVQLIASIPAFLIIFVGTRALVLFISNLRMKDFRLPRDVHSEMSDYLKKAEEYLVLSDCQVSQRVVETDAADFAYTPSQGGCLGPKEMGKLLLLLHSYLNLLDFMSPPFPGKQCESIHSSVQNLFMQGQMSVNRQLELLKVIQSKHEDLIKFV